MSGSGTSWTLRTPRLGSVKLYAGTRLQPTTDYSISGAGITTVASYPTLAHCGLSPLMMKRTIPLTISIALAFIAFPAIASASVCFIPNGCTGTSTAPAYGQLLIGGKNSEYELVATSTLFSTTSAAYWLTEQRPAALRRVQTSISRRPRGVRAHRPEHIDIHKQFGLSHWQSDHHAIRRRHGLGATSITTAFNLANSHWWTARQNFTNATTSGFEATSTDVFLDGYARRSSQPIHLISSRHTRERATHAGEPSAHDPVRPRRPRRMHFDVPHFGRDFGFGDDKPDRQYRRQYTYALAAHSRYIPSDLIEASSTVVGTFQAGTTTATRSS